MTDQNFATIMLKAGADPIFALSFLGIDADSGYGYRTEDDGRIALIVRTQDLERAAAFAEDYDDIYLQHKLIPGAITLARETRKIKMASMRMENGTTIALDDTTIDRLNQASALLDKVPALLEISWELVPGIFVTWPRDLVQAVAVAAGMHVQSCFSHQKGLYARIRAVKDAAELTTIPITTGWPGE
jgi:hypothetical protein